MGACACYRTGSPIWNAAPRADGTSAIVPPWAAISARTMARPRPVPPRHRGQVGTLVAGLGDVGAGELEEAAHHALEPLRVGGEVLEKAVALLRRHGPRVVAQQLHRALDRRERRLELVRDLRGEGADVVGALLQGARHGRDGLREPGDLPRDRPRERRHRTLLAARRAFALADHRLEGPA